MFEESIDSRKAFMIYMKSRLTYYKSLLIESFKLSNSEFIHKKFKDSKTNNSSIIALFVWIQKIIMVSITPKTCLAKAQFSLELYQFFVTLLPTIEANSIEKCDFYSKSVVLDNLVIFLIHDSFKATRKLCQEVLKSVLDLPGDLNQDLTEIESISLDLVNRYRTSDTEPGVCLLFYYKQAREHEKMNLTDVSNSNLFMDLTLEFSCRTRIFECDRRVVFD